MKKYLFFVNAEYCYAILRPLQDVAKGRGDEVAWFVFGCSSEPLQAGEVLLKTIDDAIAWRPDAVFSPGDWTPYFIPGAKVQVFHGIARNKRGAASEDGSDHYRIRGWFDLYCTHAKGDSERFQRLADQLGTFKVAKTGWPKLDPLFRERHLYGAKDMNETPVVFLASTFSPSITAAPALADTVERLSKSGRWRFIVTLHPKMDPQTIRRYEEMEGENYRYVPPGADLLAPMSEADVMLCDTSSIMYEFMFMNKPVVTVNTRNPGPWLINVSSVSDVEEGLQRALMRPEGLLDAANALCRELHEYNDGRASERVIDAVEDLLANGLQDLKPKPSNLIRKIKLRRKLGYWKRVPRCRGAR